MFTAEVRSKLIESYHFQPGEYGLDFSEIINRVEQGENLFTVQGGTGRSIECKCWLNMVGKENIHLVQIADQANPVYTMSLSLHEEGFLYHDIVTRVAGNASLGYTTAKGRHKDFSAVGFVGFSIELCHALETPFEGIKFSTGPLYGREKLDNFIAWTSKRDQFIDEGIDQSIAELEAILAMPSYLTYAKHGYGTIREGSFEVRLVENERPAEGLFKGDIRDISFILDQS